LQTLVGTTLTGQFIHFANILHHVREHSFAWIDRRAYGVFLLVTASIIIVIAACARSSTHLIVDCIVSHSDPQSGLPVFFKVAPTLLETFQ
jgi:hypothetical protein